MGVEVWKDTLYVALNTFSKSPLPHQVYQTSLLLIKHSTSDAVFVSLNIWISYRCKIDIKCSTKKKLNIYLLNSGACHAHQSPPRLCLRHNCSWLQIQFPVGRVGLNPLPSERTKKKTCEKNSPHRTCSGEELGRETKNEDILQKQWPNACYHLRIFKTIFLKPKQSNWWVTLTSKNEFREKLAFPVPNSSQHLAKPQHRAQCLLAPFPHCLYPQAQCLTLADSHFSAGFPSPWARWECTTNFLVLHPK